MPNDSHYRLQLVDETNPSFFHQLETRAMMLADEIEDKAPAAKKFGTIDWDFHQQVLGMKSWGILFHIDGWGARGESPRIARDQMRSRSLNMLGFDGIQEAYEIAVNGALHAWRRTGNPGYQRGHSTLLNAVALNPESLFYDTINPSFEKRIVNGAFWEELPNLAPYTSSKDIAEPCIERILVDKIALLDAAQARKGIEMLERNIETVYKYPSAIYDELPDLKGLSRRAIRAYGEFMAKIDESGSVEMARLAPFVRGYINVVRGRDHDGNPFFYDEDRKAMESSPLFQKYATKKAA